MIKNRFINHPLICAFIVFGGLGLALALPWFASSQGFAAKSEIDAHSNTSKATRYYVAKTGDGTNPTLGWSTAFTNVQDALLAGFYGEIWVAAGVYYPDEGIFHNDNSRVETFRIWNNNTSLLGGFDTNDTQLSDRDWEKNVTVLSGDIDGNDLNKENDVVIDTTNIRGNNAFHVVTAENVSNTVVLDGFTITAGDADGSEPYNFGGGFYCDGTGIGNVCNPTLKNIVFSGNRADYGGGMYNNSRNEGTSHPNLNNVEFYSNSATSRGGAIHTCGCEGGNANPSLNNVEFSNNSANEGGAMYNLGNYGSALPRLINVKFISNSAKKGGAIYNSGSAGLSNPSLENVDFSSNSAVEDGGAIYNSGNEGIGNPTLVNVNFSGNSAANGGAMFNYCFLVDHNPSLVNVNFSGNSGNNGGAIYNYSERCTISPTFTNATFSGNIAAIGGAMYNTNSFGTNSPVVRNSIFWNNKDLIVEDSLSDSIYNNNSTVTLIHSLVQGTGGSISDWTGTSLVDGGYNIDEKPMFITPIDPASAPTTDGDLRLQRSSPVIDKGKNEFNNEPFDLDNKKRIVDGDLDGTPMVDMGAYEFQLEYSFDDYIPLIFR